MSVKEKFLLTLLTIVYNYCVVNTDLKLFPCKIQETKRSSQAIIIDRYKIVLECRKISTVSIHVGRDVVVIYGIYLDFFFFKFPSLQPSPNYFCIPS